MRLHPVAILAVLAALARANVSDKRQTVSAPCIPQDIVYMIDSSSYIGYEHFKQQLDFIKNNIRYYNLNPQCTRIGIVTYSSGAYNQFYLNHYTTQTQLFNAIDGIQYHSGGSNTADALNFVSSQAFTTANGGRTGVPHYGILVTGSSSTNSAQTVAAAKIAQQSGLNLFAVGVGNGYNSAEMRGIASGSKNFFTSQSYNALNSVAEPLATRINGAVSPTTTQALGTPNSCLQQADIAFLVDGSGSIGSANFLKLENFVKGIVSKLDVGANKVHVGMVQFSNYPKQEFPLSMYSSRQDVMTGIDQIHYMGGGTNTADGIKYLREQVFSQSGGARPNVPRIAVVITDGRSSNPTQTAAQANLARQNNIGMIAVGVGNGVDINELHQIADDPDAANTFTVSNYDQLSNIAAQIITRACHVTSTAAPPTQAPAVLNPKPETCLDKITNCDTYPKSVCSGDYFGWSRDNCPRYCGFCTPVYTTAPPACEDKLSNCNQYPSSSCVGKFLDWAHDNCRKYCGYCDSTSQSLGFYGQCYYKGQTYKQGESWEDGCDYQCTCLEGQTGKYQCYNKCPVYYNLPSQCTLVKSESTCCLQPVCDFNPKISSFETISPGKTTDGIDICLFQGHQYYEGQTWEDGCKYTCTCTNGRTGTYKCQTLCPDYTAIPSFCHLETKPGECCAKPVCEFKTQQGSFTGSGTISGHGVAVSPTAPPACVDTLSDCDRYGTNACLNFKPWARDNCRKTCNLCVNNAPNPEPTDVCIYDGRAFHQGDTWKVGCDTTCTCENAVYGYYRCVNSCPTYNNLPSTCQTVKKAGDCCATVQCSTGTFISSTGNLATIGGGGLIQTPGYVAPTLPSGGTPMPGTGGTSFVAPSLKGCLYKGDVYISGQTWEDGCQYSCTCENAEQGLYSCRQKCPEFPTLPAECHLEVDASDPCCQRPKCTFTGTPTPVIPVYKPSTTGHNVVAPPKPGELFQGTQTIVAVITLPGNNPNPPTADPSAHPGGIGYCEYKGHTYKQGVSWEDGCSYNCVCEDASIGFYRCREKCPKYPPLPAQCQLVQDPNNRCCKVPKCSFTGQVTSISGHGQATTPKPVLTTSRPFIPQTQAPKMCVYKGNQYGQGQVWFDGCDYKCSCDDANSGFFRCTRRCPEFFNVPSGCVYVQDPNDPACCKVPQCTPTPPPGATLSPNAIATIPPGTFVGQPNATATRVGYCEYKGMHYKQNEQWMDGCDYSCICEDENTGRYKCVDRCPSFGALPPQCRMVPDFTNPCCQKPDCQFNGNFGEITGTLTPAPQPGHSVAPNLQPTNAPTPSYCVYKNAKYSQGQTWNDGCQYKCRCDDASRGLYVCNDRCPQYPNIPPQCTMITDPRDSCCRMPQCNFTPTQGQITGTLAPNVIPTKVPSQITGQANTPAPTPFPDGHTQAPQPLNFCIYKGQQYSQGQTWDDGCDYKCRCTDATLGRYVCDEMCPKYGSMPAECHMIKDAANPCCFKPVCNFVPTSGQITGQGSTPVPVPGVSTIAPVPNPNPFPNPNPTLAPLPKSVCVYRTDQYTQGQQWYDGCNFKCTCEDAMQGIYRCDKRCADYTSVPAGCTLVADPADPLCCKVPYCPPVTNSTNPNPYPTLPTGHISGGSVTKAPTPAPQPQPGVSTPAPQPGVNPTPAPQPQPKAACIYKGKQYSQGQRWRDGCTYNCVCMNAMTGVYDCTEICPKYPQLPPQCQMVQDYNQPCCKKPYCNFSGTTGEVTGQGTTLAPVPGVSTLAPQPGTFNTPAPTPKKLCSYNGVLFKQGDRWDDGCDLKCVCENEMTGYYRCNQRCAQYQSVPAGCTLETDPNDPCCRVPVCKSLPTLAPNPNPNPNPTLSPNPNPNVTPAPGVNPTPAPNMTPAPSVNPIPYIPTLAPPIINGQGVTPTPQPGVTTDKPPLPVCVYNGKSYMEGQKWQDGCQYNCECVDGMTGQYRCTERCAVYPALPSNCRMVTSQSDQCCKEPECQQVQPTPQPTPYYTPQPQPGVSTIKPPIGPIVTLAPNPNNTPAPNPIATPAPQPMPKQFCVMSGVQYTQGQQWNQGCDKICVCDDASTGHYTCSDRCKIYPNVPNTCTMVPDPNDPICCQVPQCIPVPGTNGQPTPGPTDKPQIYTDAPHAVVTGTGTPPTPLPRTTVAPQPGVSQQPTPAPQPVPKVCVYKGQQYNQGQRWQDGCDFNCVCDDAMTGKYTCTARCGDYPNLPRQCRLQRDTRDYCCYVPVCDWSATTPAPIFTPAPVPGTTQVPIPGVSTIAPQPGVNPTLAPQPKSFCVMNGVTFGQGQVLNDGCSQRCRCDDASKNYYNCYDRCANYPQVPSGCIMVTDPSDACCQIPQCNIMPTPRPNMTPAPNPLGSTIAPHLAPGQTPVPTPKVVPTPAPSPIPTAVPGQIISKPDPTRPPQQRGFCVYKGINYKQGQTWNDGCLYNCVCLDDMTGQYKCTERCPRYPNIPTYCVMVQDPNDQCCKKPFCPNVVPTPAPNMTPAPTPSIFNPSPIPGMITPAPIPGVSTLAPKPGLPTNAPKPGTVAPDPFLHPTPSTPKPQPLPKNVCIMSGKAYTQGQTWYDGCKQICVCDDGMTGHYTCNQRCATYTGYQSASCIYVPDPKDPVCCQIPQCNQVNSTVPAPVTGVHTGGGPVPTPRPIMTPAPGTYSTLAPIPGVSTLAPIPGVSTLAPNPNINNTPAPTPAPKICVYKGSVYTQGQTWRDGCQYDCTCYDAEHGKYRCTDVCPRYPGLPPQCRLVRDPMNPCCQKPDCSTPAPQVTLAPVPGVSTPAPNPFVTPTTSFCVYKGVPLRKGQTFDDACDKVCRCEDTMLNDVVCDDRCPTYPALQSGCTMVTDPRDSCCRVPQCQPTNSVTNPNTTILTGVPGTITGHTQPNPSNPFTGSRDVCLYQGKAYKTGDKWDDGCTYTCVCIDGTTGQYRCTERCARYPNVPAQCSMVADPRDNCCQKPYCQFIAPTPAPNPNLTPSPYLTPQPGVSTIAPLPGVSTIAPNPVNTLAPQPGVQPTPAPRMVCQYKNQLYRQDQVWYDDCNAVCRCEDANTGYYRCQERCAKYPNLPPTCTLVPDPKDPTCCKVASCPTPPTSVPPTPGYLIPNPNTPAPPMVTGVAPVPTQPSPYPNPNPQNTPAPQPGVSTLAPQPGVNPTQAPQPKQQGCFFNGKVYTKGQKFDDGCDYHCICVDDMTGQYSCTKRCTDYPQVPTQCVMVQDPKDACCQVPYCDYVNPSPFPHGIPTPAPNPFQTPLPGQVTVAPQPVTRPPPGYCVYKGVYYQQGQTWDDGCDKRCRCDDVSTGYYSCSERCPSYTGLPSSCRLVTDPNDSCCVVPDCNTFTPAPTPLIFNPGTNPPISGVNPSTTPKPIIVAPTYVPAVFSGSSSNNPGSYGTGPSGNGKMCVYKGKPYTQGQTWDDGCQFRCTCFDQNRGQYRCTERCPRYINLPAFCTYKQDPNDACCKIASCDVSQVPTPGVFVPTPNPQYTGVPGVNTGPSGSNPPNTYQPGFNTGPSGSNPPITYQPGFNTGPSGSQLPINPTSGTGTSGNRNMCIYKDMTTHPLGSTWQDNCKSCVCENPLTNSYRCTDRCPVYSDLPSTCYLIKDPKDNCCSLPQCSGSLSPVTVTGSQTPGTSGSNIVPVGTHTQFTGSYNPQPGTGTISGSRTDCVYKGTTHKQGESWDDGCAYTCTCTDASTGLYTCTSKCPQYPSSIPSYCKMNTVPGMCCKSLSCNIPQVGNYVPSPMLIPTPAPQLLPGQTPAPNTGSSQVIYPSGTQPVIGGQSLYPGSGYALPPGVSSGSIRNQCVYKNRLYNQGETWDDGCDYVCECMEAKTGYYQCKPQCPKYQLPQGCYTVKAAGKCCDDPVCMKPDGSKFNPVTNPQTGYPVYGSYQPGTGGFRPGYNPSTGTYGTTAVTGYNHQCIYKGRIHTQGQRWDDGCDYSCQCTDAQNGMYSCSPKCPTYTSMPSACRMVTIPGQCCQEPRCNYPAVTTIATPIIHTVAPHISGCVDAIPNCAAYGQQSCRAPYDKWAEQNCKAYCNLCPHTQSPLSNQCVDKLQNCDAYDTTSCTGVYEPWARENCRKTCNLCTTSPPAIVTHYPAQTLQPCSDKLPNCDSYDKSTACEGVYEQWAIDNCQKYCNKCNAQGNYGTTMTVQLPSSNWMIMMKGVAGVPGDLYNLWHGTGTMNPNVPEAMYLTSTYPGHYKPDLSNYWNSLCIDKVKVAIFNKGVEKANIIFDATGSDKESWFDPSRIISSTWTDIRYAPKNIFSLMGDQATGHEFLASSSGSGCNSQGWIMVSTKNNCPFEQGSQKPAFYYAPGQSVTSWGSTQPGTGDVFAILAHPNCNGTGPTIPSQTIVATSSFCIYKSKIYNQGEVWQDGCQYNCTCEDARTGFYRCQDLCPVWNNLPAGCTLEKKPGECCSQPSCGVTANTCYYGGKYYHEGEKWRDGCKYKCTCQDGKTGFYQCQTLCLNWTLPPTCRLDPAPAGKCCQVPVCPSNVQIQYPPGFVQE
ncbi:uncharacterized protein LOC132728460 isoform X2 [Ruditapes philippinarum]|uniref:uncharacterized protein LOC132728460 isoform X2 n=1 Tax=Ruditapes philippinarum TaxID=129788 RepID=UPI00295B49FB|nr:uncharacterized protein LOC132728460 isoform X2 [Ruditapes philippinarum]